MPFVIMAGQFLFTFAIHGGSFLFTFAIHYPPFLFRGCDPPRVNRNESNWPGPDPGVSDVSAGPPIVALGEVLWDLLPTGPRAGGAPFNFAFHCHQLGHPAVIVSRVGDDDLGRELRDEVRRLGISDEYIQTDHQHPTGAVRVTVDGSGQPNYWIAANVAWDHIEYD